jgi:hypothetical protein
MYEMEGARSVRLHHDFRLLVLSRALSDRPPALDTFLSCRLPGADERLRTSPERLGISSEPVRRWRQTELYSPFKRARKGFDVIVR